MVWIQSKKAFYIGSSTI